MRNEKLKKAVDNFGVQVLIKDHGYSKAMIYAAIAGTRNLGIDNAKKMAEILGVHKSVCRPDVWD